MSELRREDKAGMFLSCLIVLGILAAVVITVVGELLGG
jgi:hypothetical protein